ncbi:hypothetical protein LTR17_005422 [Elasticomyces elasticus]|nr:hypothetical protein LTR17_005422 [Elasticomyces elasticus]
MPPPTLAVTSPAAADPAANPPSTTIGLDPVDAANLAALAIFATSITDRLSRDVHGNFFIKGSKTGKDTRHGELGELFSLVTRLEEFKTIITKYIALLTPKEKEMAETEKVVSLNKSMKGVVEAMMEAKFGDKMRDLKVENDRLKEDVKKLQDAKTGGPGLVKVKDNIHGLQSSVKILEQWKTKEDKVHMEEVQGRAESLKVLSKGGVADLRADVNVLQSDVMTLKQGKSLTTYDLTRVQNRLAAMEGWKGEVELWQKSERAWSTRQTGLINILAHLLCDGQHDDLLEQWKAKAL